MNKLIILIELKYKHKENQKTMGLLLLS